jgi:cytochrome o ubiquinol oxidase operon protein cyoD
MSKDGKIVTSEHGEAWGTRARYSVGFALSLLLTLTAFALVHIHVAHHHTYPSDDFMMAALPALAVVQLFVQLVFFLHVGRESKPRWNAWALSFAITTVAIVVIGSLWIMSNLNYRMMSSPDQIQRYVNSQGDL